MNPAQRHYDNILPEPEPLEPDMSQVDACTKCGKDDWLGFVKTGEGRREGFWSVRCFRCNRTGPESMDTEDAAESWNKWQKE